MYQNYITGQTEFALSYEFKVPKDHITRLIDAFVENDIGLILMTMNLTKLGKLMEHWEVKMIKKRKNPNCNFIKLKITVRIFLLRGQQTISFFPVSFLVL